MQANLAPLIDRAATSPSLFAVDIPHQASPSTVGEWSESGAVSTWKYAVQIPGAVSMSFHATEVVLPTNAKLTVSANGESYVYTGNDVGGGELWSRIGRGDSLAFELEAATEEIGSVRLRIASLQAGYRAFAAGMSNHSHYDDLQPQALTAEATATSCAENWTCNVTPSSEGPGNATVALIVSNVGQCTGVLLNNVLGDGTPYVLTARHCQNGLADGGLPGAAANVTVYWNAVTGCGSPLGTIYDPGILTQRGARTVVEQQDAWLIRLDRPPVVDAYFAGWDATGGTFIGGFTPHHAAGTSRQFVGWYGQAAYFTMPAAALGVHYDSTFWGTINALGSGGPGASGGGLFDPSGRLVGTVVRGRSSPDASSMCPSTSPPAPSETTATAMATAFAGIFNSTADPRSTTGAVTLRSVLDPGNSGRLVMDGRKGPITVTLSNYTEAFVTGAPVSLEWSSSPGATSCLASGGEAGDGWTGPLETRGRREVTSVEGGDVIYTVTCTDGDRVGIANVTLRWTLGSPTVSLDSSAAAIYGEPFAVSWTSNVRPCVASGGTSGDGWEQSRDVRGTAMVTPTDVGPVTYTLTCGSGARSASQQLTRSVGAPLAVVTADAVNLRVGQSVEITTIMQGAPCVRTGGRAGDGWAGSVPLYERRIVKTVSASTPGTVTYAMSCGSGSHVATAQANVRFTDEPPAVSVRASRNTAVVGEDIVTLSWDSNVRPCTRRRSGPLGSFELASAPSGSEETQEFVIGQYVLSVTCGTGDNIAQGSTMVTWTGTPSVEIDAPSGVVQGALFSVRYFANVVPCTLSGGNIRADLGTLSSNGFSVQVVEPTAGTKTYSVTCGSNSQMVSARIDVEVVADAPQVTLTSDRPAQVTGQPVTLTWHSNTSPCVPGGGGRNDGWSGTFASSGSFTVTEQQARVYFFSMSCGSGSLTARATAGVNYASVPAPTLTASKSDAVVGDSISFTWSSADGSACFASGGWTGHRAATGSAELTQTTPGPSSFMLQCGDSLTAIVEVTFRAAPTVPNQSLPPSVNLAASSSSLTTGDTLTLTWTTLNVVSCTASNSPLGSGWSGALDTNGGSRTLTVTASGALVYEITCSGAGGASVTATARVTANQPTLPPSGGGGGALGLLDGALLLGGIAAYLRRRYRVLEPLTSTHDRSFR